MTRPLLPHLPTATAHNRRLVLSPELDAGSIDYGYCPVPSLYTEIAQEELEQKRAYAAGIAANGNAIAGLDALDVTSWPELAREASVAVNRYVDGCDFSAYEELIDLSVSEIVSQSKQFAAQSIATCVAFLRVIPEVVQDGQAVPSLDRDKELAQIAMKSKGFIISWAAMHSNYDAATAKALSGAPRTKMTPFNKLRFVAGNFIFQDGRVVVDPARYQQLEVTVLDENPSAVRNNTPVAAFGCPAARLVPVLYDGLVSSAEHSALFAA